MNSTVNIFFFAVLAERLKCQNEELHLPEHVSTAKQLQNLLTQRKGNWLALKDANIRCAVNQNIVEANHPVKAGDEIAFFPPVTGG